MPQLADAIQVTDVIDSAAVIETPDSTELIEVIERRSSSRKYFAHGPITRRPGVAVAETGTLRRIADVAKSSCATTPLDADSHDIAKNPRRAMWQSCPTVPKTMFGTAGKASRLSSNALVAGLLAPVGYRFHYAIQVEAARLLPRWEFTEAL